MSYGTDILLNILNLAESDPDMRRRLDQDPSGVYIGLGFKIEDKDKLEFNDLFRNGTATFLNQPFNALSFKANNSFKCIACKLAVFVIASSIVALGAVGIASLTPSSGIVLALASLAGCSPANVLAFLVSLSGSALTSASNLVKKICQWAGICI